MYKRTCTSYDYSLKSILVWTLKYSQGNVPNHLRKSSGTINIPNLYQNETYEVWILTQKHTMSLIEFVEFVGEILNLVPKRLDTGRVQLGTNGEASQESQIVRIYKLSHVGSHVMAFYICL
jgi:hypothetical protein